MNPKVAGIVRPETLRERQDLKSYETLIVAPEVGFRDLTATVGGAGAPEVWPYLRTDVVPAQGPHSAFYHALRAGIDPENLVPGPSGTFNAAPFPGLGRELSYLTDADGNWFLRRTRAAVDNLMTAWMRALVNESGFPGFPGSSRQTVFLDQAFTVLPVEGFPFSRRDWNASIAYAIATIVYTWGWSVVANTGGLSVGFPPNLQVAGVAIEKAHVLAAGAPVVVSRLRTLSELGIRKNVVFDLAIDAPGVVRCGTSLL